MPSNVTQTFLRTLFNPFGSKSIEAAKDAHSNLLTNTENVFELQHHTVKPSAMVKISIERMSFLEIVMNIYACTAEHH